MKTRTNLLTGAGCLLLLTALGACAPSAPLVRAPEPVPALPAVPRVEGPVEIEVAYPQPGMPQPSADSTFIFGTVGSGAAELTINGYRVPVAPNGAFLAYLPVPEDGEYRLVARTDGYRYGYGFSYRQPEPAPAGPAPAGPAPAAAVSAAVEPEAVTFPAPRLGTVVGGKDTLATGSEIVHAAPTPGGDRRWFFPRGTRLTLLGRRGADYHVRLAEGLEAWVDTSGVRLDGQAAGPAEPVGRAAVESGGRVVDVRLPVAYAPFRIDPDVQSIGVVVYRRSAPEGTWNPGAAPFIEEGRWQAGADSVRLQLALAEPLWGFKAFYDEAGALVLRLRRPPRIVSGDPLRGVRVMIDPGHPPGGAIGPTGLTEAEANLAISLLLAEMLRERGAEVVLTRTSEEALVSATSVAAELWGRVDLAVAEDADLLVSVHNNAFPVGVNPFENYGTETYYYWPFSEPLAQTLLREIAVVTGIPVLGAKQRSLALVRPSWMPSVLTEALFMMFPQQEAALRSPAFLERLAEAHLEGIAAFLRGFAGEQ